MLNPFPIQFLSLLAYLILRIIVGALLVYFGVRHLRQREALVRALRLSKKGVDTITVFLLALLECVTGIMFILGYYTQIAALGTILMAVMLIVFRKQFNTDLLASRAFYVLLAGAAVSLFITGAGTLAFDLPI